MVWRRAAAVIFPLVMLICLALPAAASELYVGGEKVEFDLTPDQINEEVLIPLDQLTDEYSMEIVRLSEGQVFIFYRNQYCILNLGKYEAQLNNEFIILKEAPLEVNGHYLVPLGFICEFLGVDYSSHEGVIQIPIPILIKDLEVQVLLEDRFFHNGDRADFHILLKNVSGRKQVLHFNSGQRFDLIIKNQAGEIVYRWSRGKMFIQAVSKVVLEPGESMLFSGTLEIRGLQPGLYELYGLITCHEEIVSEPIKIVVKKF